MQPSEFVYLNHTLVNANEASISIYDTSVLHGIGLFETMRSYNGKIFRLKDHLSRIAGSVSRLGMNVKVDQQELTTAIECLLEANNLSRSSARLKLTITPGSIRDLGQTSAGGTIIITASSDQVQNNNVPSAMPVIITMYRINDDEPTAGHKTLNYFNRLTMLQQAHREGYGEALPFSVRGNLCGGCLSNVFLVKDGRLLTPATGGAIIPGITRKAVLEIASELAIPVQECDLGSAELMEADELFLTGTSIGIVPVSNIGKHQIGAGTCGELTRKIFTRHVEMQHDAAH